MLLRALSLLILLPTLYYLGTFPIAQIPLLIGAGVYFGLLLWRPNLWLFIVPLLLPVLYLTPWSGRIFFDEFDALILLTVSAALWNGRYIVSARCFSPGIGFLLFIFIAVYIAAVIKGLLPLPEFDANATANYYSNLNSLRSAKGLLWALLLYPAWTAEQMDDSSSAKQLFFTGLAAGVVCVILVVLWERKVFYTLIFWTNKYAPIQALLNFTTQYRITALFADMHIGGATIDGYLLLVLPFTALLFSRAKSFAGITLGMLVLLGTLYASMVTFSRGVYLGIAVAALSSAVVVMYQNRKEFRFSTAAILVGAFSALLANGYFAFRGGGTIALFAAVAAFFFASVFARIGPILKTKYLYGSLVLVSVLLIAFVTSNIYSGNYAFDSIPPLVLAFLFVFFGLISGYIIGARFRVFLTAQQSGAIIIAVSFLVILLVPSVFGYRMDARFSSLKSDLLHRVEHWGTAVNIMDKDLPTTMFGQGLGRFPITYFWRHQDPKNVGGFSFQQEQDNQFLSYQGAKDVRLGQRISLQPNTDYTVSLDIRTNAELALLYLRACHRQLIHPTEWNPSCIEIKKKIESTDGQWKRFEFPISSGKVGSLKSLLRAPLVFSVSNRRHRSFELRPQTVLDFDNISIRAEGGSEILKNGDFESGIDHWFGYYDFNHLPWHIENIWVHVYFELGAIGLLLFILLILNALIRTVRSPPGNRFAFALFISLIGFLAVGCFNTLIDSPRIAFLFYLILLFSLGARSTISAENTKASKS